jgi:hypothetical protein
VGSRTSSHAQEAKGRREPSTKGTNCIANSQPNDNARNQEWYTDELGNRARMIYNAKTADFETPYDLSRGFSLA